ncbi:hypothetical protein [Tenacibaculum amylolyticum]|uniref:hypothetical protein n=1 Tax=Tenacibaculum amylolyticum TaxID=104269 RepID=UPI003893DA92
MVILKKIKASSLNEVIVATVIIVLVFSIAMGILTNILRNSIKRDTHQQELLINELIYDFKNEKITLPYLSEEKDWSIDIQKEKEGNLTVVNFTVISKKNKKKITRKIIYNEES